MSLLNTLGSDPAGLTPIPAAHFFFAIPNTLAILAT